MPRPRPLRTKEEIAAVPADKSVTISLGPEDNAEPGLEAPEFTGNPEDKGLVGLPRNKNDDETIDLKKQLDDLRKAKEDSDRRIQEEIRARQEAERLAREREQEIGRSRIRAEDAEYDAILNAIGAAEVEAERAQREIALATESGDHKAVGDATRLLARAESRLVQLNDGKEAIERAKTEEARRAKEAPRQQPQQQQPTVEQYIDSLPNLLPSQRDWLRRHTDALTDTRKNMKLQGAHVEAEDQGLRPGSAEYFDYLDQRLGYRERNVNDDDDGSNRQYLDVSAPVSAPPSRQATNPGTGRQANSNRITLTPEQREVARLSGIDELTYARQLQKLQQLKADGHYSNN